MKESRLNKYDILLFVLIICTAGGMWGGALKPARIFSILFFVPMILSYRKVNLKMVQEVVLYLVFLTIWSLASILWTPNPFLGISEWGNLILRILFFLELVVFGVLSKNTFNTMINGWATAFLITAVIAVWELSTGNHLSVTNYTDGAENMNLGGGQTFVRHFAQATFYNYNGYVTFIGYCLPFLFCLAFKWNSGFKQLLAAVPIFFVLYVLVLNASRGGIIAFLIFAVLFSYFRLTKSKLWTKLSFVILLVAFLVLFAHFWDLMSFYFEYKLETGGMASSRFQIWECCWQALIETGFIGCGIGGVMDTLEAHHALIPQPHNFFIEFLLEFGILVFIWFVVLMWKTFRMGQKCKDNSLNYVRISSFFAIPFISIIDSGYVQTIGIWAFLGSLFLLCIKCKMTNPINA